MKLAFTALRGILYAAGFVLLWGWIAASVQRYDPRLPFTIAPWLRPIGLALIVAGALIDAWCVATFVTRGRGTPAPFDPPREFVATGPYRYVRNPMYIGAALVILGAGLALRSPAIVLLSGFFLLFFHVFVVLYEERALAPRFGESYRRYKRMVRRWLPGRPGPAGS